MLGQHPGDLYRHQTQENGAYLWRPEPVHYLCEKHLKVQTSTILRHEMARKRKLRALPPSRQQSLAALRIQVRKRLPPRAMEPGVSERLGGLSAIVKPLKISRQ